MLWEEKKESKIQQVTYGKTILCNVLKMQKKGIKITEKINKIKAKMEIQHNEKRYYLIMYSFYLKEIITIELTN